MGVLGNPLVDSQFVAIFPVVSADSESKSWLSWLAVSPEAGITSAGWLLGFGKKAKLLYPDDVVEQFQAYMDKIREMY